MAASPAENFENASATGPALKVAPMLASVLEAVAERSTGALHQSTTRQCCAWTVQIAKVKVQICQRCQPILIFHFDYLADEADKPRRARLQTMHSFPINAKWNTCSNCQMMHTSMSCGSFTPQPTVATAGEQQPPPKINIIPAGPLHRSLSSGASRAAKHPPAAAKVKAEAEHLREIEGQDYQMMGPIIRRRLHRDSEDLDNSL